MRSVGQRYESLGDVEMSMIMGKFGLWMHLREKRTDNMSGDSESIESFGDWRIKRTYLEF